MKLSKEELILINEALIKAKAQTETEDFAREKIILSSCQISTNENVAKLIQELYSQLLFKIDEAMKDA